MRLGLVAVGLAFVVVGAGLVASFFVFSSNVPPGALTRTITASQIAPNQTQVWTLDTVGTPHGSLSLSWSSNVPTNVTFSQGTGCSSSSGICPISPALAVWDANSSGSWKGTGNVGSGYVVTVTARANRAVSFNASLAESYPGTPFGFASPVIILITVASVLLLGTGAIGVFLGLFLRGGVYEAPPPARRRADIYGDLGVEPDDDEDGTLGPPE